MTQAVNSTRSSIVYPEPPPAKTITHEKLGVINTVLVATRSFFITLSATVIPALSAFENPIFATKVLSVTGVIYAVPNAVKKIRKVWSSSGWKRFDHGANAVRFLSYATDSIGTVIRGFDALNAGHYLGLVFGKIGTKVYIVISATTLPLFSLSVVLNIGSVVVHSRELYKTHHFRQIFLGLYAKQSETRVHSYDDFHQLVKKTSNVALERLYQTNGQLLRDRLDYLDRLNPTEEQKTVLLKTLDARLKTTINNQSLQILSDIVSITAMTIILTSLFHPLGWGFLGVYCVAVLVNHSYRNVASYNFENKIGLIARKQDYTYDSEKLNILTRTLFKIADFVKWRLCLLDRFNLLREQEELFPDMGKAIKPWKYVLKHGVGQIYSSSSRRARLI